jgi:CYTH domain-containing protein
MIQRKNPGAPAPYAATANADMSGQGAGGVALEIERRFLVDGDGWRALAGPPQRIVQGYLARGDHATIRVRKIGETGAVVTVKGPRRGPARAEFEYPIPAADADAMLADLCAGPLVEKDRHALRYAGQVWVVDVYRGDAEGMVVAEVELEHPRQAVRLPDWIGREVTGDPRFGNQALAARGPRRRTAAVAAAAALAH